MFESHAQSKASEGKSKAISEVAKVSASARGKYATIFILFLSLTAALGFLKFDYPSKFYIAIEVFALLLGIIHVWQMGKRFGWRNIHSFNQKLGFTLLILIFAMVAQGIIVYFCKPIADFWLLFPTSLLFFLFPLLAISCFDFAVDIPAPIYKKWKYPENMIMPDMDMIDFSNSHIVTFELRKNINDAGNTFMKFKAPQDRLTFGDLFYLYMFEYNEKHRESPIQFLNSLQQPYEWLFFIKPQKWYQSKIYIDPSLTVRENKIKENFIIVSERVK